MSRGNTLCEILPCRQLTTRRFSKYSFDVGSNETSQVRLIIKMELFHFGQYELCAHFFECTTTL